MSQSWPVLAIAILQEWGIFGRKVRLKFIHKKRAVEFSTALGVKDGA